MHRVPPRARRTATGVLAGGDPRRVAPPESGRLKVVA